MLFEEFTLNIHYRGTEWELDVRECYRHDGTRRWEILQGGIVICFVNYNSGIWNWEIAAALHPVVLEDTLQFLSNELKSILQQGVLSYYECFTDRKIKI